MSGNLVDCEQKTLGIGKYIQCIKCKKLINTHTTNSIQVFKDINGNVYLLYGKCPHCNHKYEFTCVNTVSSIIKKGIKVIEDKNGDIEKILLWGSNYYIIDKVPKTETVLYCYKINPKKHTFITYHKRNSKIVKKSIKFNRYLSGEWEVDILPILKKYDFIFNDTDLNKFTHRHPHINKQCMVSVSQIAKLFRYVNIKVGGIRLIGEFHKQQIKKLKRYTKKYGNNIPPRKFVELMLYGKPNRYKGNIPYRDFLKFFRVNTYLLSSHYMFYKEVYELSRLITNAHDILDFSVMLCIFSQYSNKQSALDFITRLLAFKNVTTVKKLLVQMVNSLNTNNHRLLNIRWCFNYITNKYPSNNSHDSHNYTSYIIRDIYVMLAHELTKSEFKRILPLLKQKFPKGVDIVKLHDTLIKLIEYIEHRVIQYKYTNYILQLFTKKINGYSFVLPKDSIELKVHANNMNHCAYSVYRRKHNENNLIIMVKDEYGKDIATLRFEHKSKIFSEIENKSSIKTLILREAKLKNNKQVSTNTHVNKIVVKYFDTLKEQLNNKLTSTTSDIRY